MPAVVASDLFHLYRASFGDVAALRGLSLEVADGEAVAVLGPSGAGKSTLLALCAGFLRQSSGELTVLGRQLERASAREVAQFRRASIGLVRQHYHLALPRELTVEEIVALPLRLLGRSGRHERRRIESLLATAGLGTRAGARPYELSGGEQQRVAVCAALAKRPRLVLADEPTGELDARATEAVVDLLLGLAGEVGSAALLVTHDPAVSDAADRTIHIRDGRLAAEGTTHPVLILDPHGWLRLPQRLRDRAGIRERVRAEASWGRIELFAEGLQERRGEAPTAPPVEPAEKRYKTEVALAGVTKSYGAPLLVGLSATFAPERLHVVAGPSGSGKTTLLNLVAALDYPDDGQVWVAGERVDSLNAEESARWRRRALGYVSQHSTLVDFLSARENVELALRLRGFDDAETRRRAERWLDWVGLEKLAERRADQLSGGEQRRVALARALAPAPRLLVADEPTAHLDRFSGRLVIRLLERAVEQGTTVLAASHDPDVIAAAQTTLMLPAEIAATAG
ncbi:MAG TPA: ATP-binding cassette domain-containing protein [Gaiellaceae bacterium]|jgi:ABC-type lipoprotein export system ATPase subunit|nr:ATP-binding cassette domain-containing protein [Gaiellaceae bacterium]